MQVIKLVHPGHVDRVMAFDELPKDLLQGLRTYAANGFPRHWKQWLKDVGSKTTIQYMVNGEMKQREEECFFGIEYLTINKDKERWQEIVSHVRRNCDASIRLLDKFEDMAKPLAPDCYQPLSLEPEEVPIVPLKKKLIVQDDSQNITEPTQNNDGIELEKVKNNFVCETCKREFTKKIAWIMHSRTHNVKEKAVVQT